MQWGCNNKSDVNISDDTIYLCESYRFIFYAQRQDESKNVSTPQQNLLHRTLSAIVDNLYTLHL